MTAPDAGLAPMLRQRIDWAGRAVDIEYAWVGPAVADAAADAVTAPPLAPPLAPLVFLHEGLGSLSMWRDFPQRLCAAVGRRGLVYSRPGYGRSTPRAPNDHWGLDFMHQQALDVLPALLQALGVASPVVLFGHSDGGSIALIHAAQWPQQVAATIVMAPHILVEEFGLVSIRKVRDVFETTDLRDRLARHHDDVESAFRGWNDIWLHPDFPSWSIESLLPNLRPPLLAIQGLDDEYGTLAQIDGIAAAAPGTLLLKLPACGHSPHKDQPVAVIAACRELLSGVG